jgi:hypothetical protein
MRSPRLLQNPRVVFIAARGADFASAKKCNFLKDKRCPQRIRGTQNFPVNSFVTKVAKRKITPEQTYGHQIQKSSDQKSSQETSQEGCEKSCQEEVISISILKKLERRAFLGAPFVV